MHINQNLKYKNDKIIYYLLILIWLINLFSINTGFYSVKNFYYKFNLNQETLINFLNTIRWFGPILVLPILIKLFLNNAKTELFSKVIIFWSIFQLIYIFFLERDVKILEINSPQVIDSFNLIINSLLTIFLFKFLENKYEKDISIFFYILIFFIFLVSAYFFYKILYFSFVDLKFTFYHNEALIPGKQYFGQPVPRITGLSRMLIILFIFLFFFKDIKDRKLGNKLLLNFILIFLSFLIFSSQTRGALVGIFVFTLVYFLFLKINLNKKIFNSVLIILIPFVLSLLISQTEFQKNFSNSNRFADTFISISNLLNNENNNNNHASKIETEIETNKNIKKETYNYTISSGRIEIWKTSINLIVQNKKYLGYGPQGDRYTLSVVAKDFNEASWQNNASNAVIYSIMSSGIIGLICLLLIYFSLSKILLKAIRFNSNFQNQDYLFYSSFTIILFISVRSLFENSFTVFGIDYCLIVSSYFLLKSKIKN